MILMLKLISGKPVLIDFDDVISAEETFNGDTLLTCMREGRVFKLNVVDTVEEIYNMLPYEDDDDC